MITVREIDFCGGCRERGKMRFVGLDLAWVEGNPSGVAVLDGDCNAVALAATPNIHYGLASLVAAVGSPNDTIVAIDGPLVVGNSTGRRPCEQLVSQRYGRHGASCHSTNLTLYPDPIGVRLVRRLHDCGYLHYGARPIGLPGVVMEVYPHPAIVTLFDLPGIIRYKKGSVADKRAGLAIFRMRIAELVGASPSLRQTPALARFLSIPLNELRGRAIKEYEDGLDAIFCAYLAAFYWCWQSQRAEALGSVEAGYIVVPTHTANGLRWPLT